MIRKISGVALLVAVCLTAHAADRNTQITSQGGTSVTLGDVDDFLSHFPRERWAGFLDAPKRIDQMILGLLRDKQLAALAVEEKLDQDPQVKGQIAMATMQILSKARMDAFEKSLTIPDMTASAKEEYTTHKAAYMTISEVEVQHVLIAEGKQRSDSDAKALAEKVRAEAIANPAGFDQLVAKYSDDPSKMANQGHIPDATSKKVKPDFAAAAALLRNKDEISPVVKTKFGYHVLKLINATPARALPFDEVKDKIIATLKESYIDEQRKAFMAKLDQGTPNVNPQIMELLNERYHLSDLAPPATAASVKTP